VQQISYSLADPAVHHSELQQVQQVVLLGPSSVQLLWSNRSSSSSLGGLGLVQVTVW
jgi:hypothetical protein